MPEIVPTRRTVIRTAAWAVPAVTVAAAAPAFAASPTDAPNLSASTSNPAAPSRSGNQVTIEPATLRNTGGVAANGVVIVFTTGVALTAVELVLPFGVFTPAALGGSADYSNPNRVVVTIPASLATVPAGTVTSPGVFVSSASQRLTFANSNPSTLQVGVTAANGGVAFASAQVTV